jgi:O-antigen ligase
MALVVSTLSLCLFGECLVVRDSSALGEVPGEVAAAMSDPDTQWMVFVCAGVYFLAFVILRRQLAGGGRAGAQSNVSLPREPWLLGLLGVAALAYALHYTKAVNPAQALTLLGGAVFGQGAAVWAGWGGTGLKSSVQSLKSGRGTVVSALIVLLTGVAVWQAEPGHGFQYRGLGRWSGPWGNPNTFGVLMGVGMVLSVGSLKSKVQSRLSAEGGMPSAECEGKAGGEHPTSNIQHRTSNLVSWLQVAFFLGAAGVMGVGLMKSYSRGAWVGAAVGLALIANAECRRQNEECRSAVGWAGRRWVLLAIICASFGVLGFWSFRDTERVVARRAYTVANANDFSWRKRVAAYEGAVQMMADKPWFGYGWNQPEAVYDQYYRAAKVDEGMAIQLNDYLMLGMTLGLPALLCFVVYVGLSLRGSPRSKVQGPKSGRGSLKSKVQSLKSEAESPESQNESSAGAVQGRVGAGQKPEQGAAGAAAAAGPTLDLRRWTLDSAAVCRAGTVVLLVGFWFDGGLFKLATAAPFWILLELGRVGNHEIHEAHEND